MVEPAAAKPYTAILVCASQDILAVMSGALSRNGLESQAAPDGAAALRLARKARPDFVFACRDLADSSGLKVIQSAKKRFPLALGAIVGPSISQDEKRRMLDDGADAYVEVDVARPENAVSSIAKLVARKQIGIIGNNERIVQIVETIETIAPTKVTVLITGESGTGKELIARAIHQRSNRSTKPFVAVNCAALPQGILESELFGHEKGAFTGAVALRKGRFEIANGGTLLLDEVGEMPLGTQVKLLRVLEEEHFMRVGGSQDVTVDVRVLASTNRDLRQLVEEGSFRTDLFYRLNVIPIHVPPLRERKEDIPAMFRAIMAETCMRNGVESVDIDDEALAALVNYPWPGNVRELRNLVESLIVLAGGKPITPASLPEHILRSAETRDLPVKMDRPRSESERDLYLWRLADIGAGIADLTKLVIGMRDALER
ncbi:MAG TPA: sigma-54 dependent transcriptional regulator, partial [bacterium]|nr:sigma-54 dependent transcriptional regulator [bacterium]